ncbi:hypothetical protein LCGC14_1575360 [marine sediment metagenome]|uniref:FCP1 homology domain-containing protein n=1 Tax=marine sediment metagenome TaxID=412755 RepID=A0A0F9IIJ4_9ZZZZ
MIFLDLDGVLAEFCVPFSRVIQQFDPTMPTITTATQPDWGTWGGEMTDERLSFGWEVLKKVENFWETVPSLAPPSVFARLAAAHKEIPILFVTSRIPTLGNSVQRQCINWLEERGILDPLVIVAGGDARGRTGKTDKASIARIWSPYFIIEDGPQNALDYAAAGFEVALLDWPYTANTKAPGIHRCNLDEALEMAGVPYV